MTSGEWYARLLDELAHLSDRDDAWLPPAEGPVAELAAREIGRAAERLLRQGRSIDGDSPDDALHQLRKDGKRLRYLIESFAALLPDDDSDALVTRLKELQNHLGAYQDVCFEMRDLASFRQRLLDSDRVGGQTVAAMDGLIASLQRRREALRAEFEAVFARFDAPETRVSVDAVAGRS